MKPDVMINDISMDSLGWLRESISFPPVKSQTNTVTVPGRNAPIRFSVINNRISYQPRTFKIVLVMLGYRDRFMQMVSDASQKFAGVLSQVIFSEKPDVYALGTLQLESEYDVDAHKGTLTITCEDADAFLYHTQITSLSFSGTVEAKLSCDFMPVVPSISVTEDTKLEWMVDEDTLSKDLSAGTWTIPSLELHQGENTVRITTKGTVTFEYREGCL